MMVSEEQAAFAWCPFIRSPQGAPCGTELVVVGGCNAQANGSKVVDRTSCVGSQCMSWRWAGWRIDKKGEAGLVLPNPEQNDRVGPRLGYCGLAGKPYGAV